MCILFFSTLLNPSIDEYNLILTNVRDEFFNRPTQLCSFWDNQTHLIGAKDLQKGREGGTWLAMNTNGKIGVLLNILEPDNEISADRKSRGFLVVDYLRGDYSPQSYLEKISRNPSDYNGFKMITIEINSDRKEMAYFSSSDDKVISLSSGIYGFGNNKSTDILWPKVNYGKKRFEQLVNKYSKTSSKSQLIDGIFELLSDKTLHPLDEQMKSQGKGKPINIIEKFNALNVEISELEYGSRSYILLFETIILNKILKQNAIYNTSGRRIQC